MSMTIPEPDVHNRTEHAGQRRVGAFCPPGRRRQVLHDLRRRPRAGAANIFKARLPEEYHDRLPSVVTKRSGEQVQKTEGFRPTKLNWVEPLQGHEKFRYESGRKPDQRAAGARPRRLRREILFPTSASPCGL